MTPESRSPGSPRSPRIPGNDAQRGIVGRVGAFGVLLALSFGMTGCGLAAAPCRVASAGLKIVPLVGHVAAVPTDACAEVIDP
ncbi:hypothetical protein J2794_001756 [Paraburkholderia terricola]|nr:DUF6726 family protein [Paraburkholderia terricola]MDR6445665.1 hypothetical protein [Paraburkholderia terricola]